MFLQKRGRAFKFPSAVAIKKHSQAEITEEDIFNFDGINYLVGDAAVRDAMTTKDFVFLEKFAPLLLFKSIIDANLDPTSEINLTTGLSLLNWSSRENFAARITDFIVNKTHVKKINLQVIPQGKGIFVSCCKAMPELKDKLVLIIDIGYNSLDLIPFHKGKALASEAWATSQGINLIIDEARKLINGKYHLSFNETRVNQILQDGFLTISGEKKDLSIMIMEEKHLYQQILMNEIQTRNPDIYKTADAIIIGGGGGYSLVDLEFNKNVIFAPQPLEFSNVCGYWDILTGDN